MRALAYCFAGLFWSISGAYAEKPPQPDFEIQFKKDEVTLKGTIYLSTEILQKYLDKELLKKHANDLEELSALKREDYEIKEIKKDGRIVGLEISLDMKPKTKVNELALAIEKLPEASFEALPEAQRTKIRSLLTMMKLYKNLPEGTKGKIKIAALLPASGKTAGQQAEIHISAEINL